MTNYVNGWRLCGQCNSMWLNIPEVDNVCPAGGQHTVAVGMYSWDFMVNQTDGGNEYPYEGGWTACSKCASLSRPYQGSPGPCPAGGTHAFTLPYSVQYATSRQDNTNAVIMNWRICQYCRVMMLEDDTGVCKASPDHVHHQDQSYYYYGQHDPVWYDIYYRTTESLFGHIYSPDGSASSAQTGAPVYPNDGTASAIGTADMGGRRYFVCRSNDGDNLVMFGSTDHAPVSLGIYIVGSAAPAIACFKGQLYVFHCPWYQNKYGYGPIYCVPVYVDANGNFTGLGTAVNVAQGDNMCSTRICATVTGVGYSNETLWCGWSEPFDENDIGNIHAAYTSDGATWGYAKYDYRNANPSPGPIAEGSPTLLPMPNGEPAVAFFGQFYRMDYLIWQAGKWIYNDPCYLSGPTPSSDPSWALTGSRSQYVYVTYYQGSQVNIFRYLANFVGQGPILLEHGAMTPDPAPAGDPPIIVATSGTI